MKMVHNFARKRASTSPVRKSWKRLSSSVLLCMLLLIYFTLDLNFILNLRPIPESVRLYFRTRRVPQPSTSSSQEPTKHHSQVQKNARAHKMLTEPQILHNVVTSAKVKPNITRVIIVAYQRSGSSFMGDLLNSKPRTFYFHEPLQPLNFSEMLGDQQLHKALDILTAALACNFTDTWNYTNKRKKWRLTMEEKRFFWSLNPRNARPGVTSKFATAVCQKTSFLVTKLVRLSIRQIHYWMTLNRNLSETVKVVHLVRDPRAIWSSRHGLKWCRRTCASAKSLCEQMRADLDAFETLKGDFPDSMFRVLYEDFVRRLPGSAEELFSAFGETFTEDVLGFIKSHTSNVSKKYLLNAYSTMRDPYVAITKWRTKIKARDLTTVQEYCHDVIRRLGHQLIGGHVMN